MHSLISTSENHSKDLILLQYRYRTFTTVVYNTGLAQVRKQGFIGRYPSHTLYQFLPVITVIDCYCVLSYHRTVIRHIRSWILSLPQVIKPSCPPTYQYLLLTNRSQHLPLCCCKCVMILLSYQHIGHQYINYYQFTYQYCI